MYPMTPPPTDAIKACIDGYEDRAIVFDDIDLGRQQLIDLIEDRKYWVAQAAKWHKLATVGQ